ncbi:MAG: hypothetical protein P0Y56_13975 [Candidatus Andeanibacterium colombiense]|uniref:Uncharacterized protein n=1 Tax=Candidatus Andeanibacterium colombiense TaxID=3121345 RepID=A0AAJ5X5T9_9SPHN|nr:MAG: hypothetical protein P0Y56_13975 [Sphingomonadaceae bacterium]
MTRISNVDQMLMLLRHQLGRLGKSDRARRSGTAGASTAERRRSAAGRIEAVMRTDDLSEEELGRTVIAALLVDEFGEGAANDHKFRKVADEVYRIIASDPEAKRLLGEAIGEIGKPAA